MLKTNLFSNLFWNIEVLLREIFVDPVLHRTRSTSHQIPFTTRGNPTNLCRGVKGFPLQRDHHNVISLSQPCPLPRRTWHSEWQPCPQQAIGTRLSLRSLPKQIALWFRETTSSNLCPLKELLSPFLIFLNIKVIAHRDIVCFYCSTSVTQLAWPVFWLGLYFWQNKCLCN